ncbi:hypothetical protein BCR44DRAFT_1431442 [Catenaria anguillulae PL171]|uniref:Uncharacterized protein n=1 Tax=Catenaria anguillulae PL171 TaxID=765915 RepID=A0A1Y2HR71_9FUNG|nr:hypothetical protein BCR44DRAFT_1431442 [Catenaria anguillulae PL171]
MAGMYFDVCTARPNGLPVFRYSCKTLSKSRHTNGLAIQSREMSSKWSSKSKKSSATGSTSTSRLRVDGGAWKVSRMPDVAEDSAMTEWSTIFAVSSKATKPLRAPSCSRTCAATANTLASSGTSLPFGVVPASGDTYTPATTKPASLSACGSMAEARSSVEAARASGEWVSGMVRETSVGLLAGASSRPRMGLSTCLKAWSRAAK